MLQSLHDRSKGWLTGVIVFLICVAFALWGVHSYTGNGGDADTAAKVDGQVIQQGDLNQAYQRLRQQQQMQMGADFVIDAKMEASIRKQALDQLIMARVLTKAANKEGYRVSMSEVYAALLMIPAFQVDGHFSLDRFNEVIGSLLYNRSTFLSDMQVTMLTNQVRSGFVASAFALPSETAAAVKLVNQKRDFSYLLIPINRFLPNIKISPDQANAYYNANQAEFTTPEQVSVQYIELSLPQIAAQLTFTNDQLQQFYQDNLANYTTPQRWQVAHILVKVPADATSEQKNAAKLKADAIAQKVRDGANFSKLAATDSDDKISAANGGVLDWFSTGMVDPAFEKAVTGLKVDEISEPVKTKYGYSVIKLLDVQKPMVSSFAKVRPQVEKGLAQQQAEKIFADASDKLSNLTYANPSSLDVAAHALNLQVKSSQLFDRKGGKDEVTSNAKALAAAFSPDVMQGNNSDVIQLGPDTLVVLRIKQHVPPTLQPFDAVKDVVIQKLKMQIAVQQAQDLGMQMVQQIDQGKNARQVAEQNRLAWQAANNVGRFGSKVPLPLVNAAFRMPTPAKPGALVSTGFPMPNGDFAVLMLTGVQDGSLGKGAQTQERIYREELESVYGRSDYSLYVRGLIHKAKVVIENQKSSS